MGKNKKNRSQNFVNLDADGDDDGFTTVPKNKNLFAQLDQSDQEYSEECGRECGRECDGAHATFKLEIKSETKSETKFETKPDEYFAKGYHYDDYENDYENALIYYKMSLENDSKEFHGVASNNMGIIYEEKIDDIAKAEFYYKMACDNNYEDAFAHLGLLYYKQEKYTDAVKYFEQSVKYGNVNNYYQYAVCLEKIGNKAEALTYLQYYLMLKNATLREKKMFSRLMHN
jgi:tetratricopeptide (TPR) repeat protein